MKNIAICACFLLSFLFIGSCNSTLEKPKSPILYKSMKNSKLLGELSQLQIDWENYIRNHQGSAFVPSNSRINIKDGYLRVDVVAINDVRTLEAQLRSLGMRKISVYGRFISGDFLVSALGRAAKLKDLRSMRLVHAIRNRK